MNHALQSVSVSVIIVNYNTKQLTKQCIASICEYTQGVDYEVILVDNASTDGSRDVFSKDKRIHYIYNDMNLGFGMANNLGLKYAHGKYLFLLNSDTVLMGNVIKHFYDIMEHLPGHCACIGCQLLNKKNRRIHSFGSFKIRTPSKVELGEMIRCGNTQLYRVDYITGADLFIRRSVVNTLGLFDPDFFMYYEDVELQYRYTKHGYYSYFIPDSMIVHLVRGSSADCKQIGKMLMMADGQRKYVKKTRSSLTYAMYRIVKIIFSIRFLFDKRLTIGDRVYYLRCVVYPTSGRFSPQQKGLE